MDLAGWDTGGIVLLLLVVMMISDEAGKKNSEVCIKIVLCHEVTIFVNI